MPGTFSAGVLFIVMCASSIHVNTIHIIENGVKLIISCFMHLTITPIVRDYEEMGSDVKM